MTMTLSHLVCKNLNQTEVTILMLSLNRCRITLVPPLSDIIKFNFAVLVDNINEGVFNTQIDINCRLQKQTRMNEKFNVTIPWLASISV